MGERAPRCWYPILMIVICIKLVLEASISFRAAPKSVHITFSQFAAVKNQPIPSHKTISRWLTRVGLYKLNCPKEKANDWALIVDNSVQIGTQKCLVVLGVRLSKFQGKALRFEDMEMLAMEFHDRSDARIICKALEKVQEKVGTIAMVCADDGTDLRKGVSLFCKKYHVGRVFDVIHKIGTFLKKLLEKDPEWKKFTSAAAEAKKRCSRRKQLISCPPIRGQSPAFSTSKFLCAGELTLQ